jgi:hypothetical protein
MKREVGSGTLSISQGGKRCRYWNSVRQALPVLELREASAAGTGTQGGKRCRYWNSVRVHGLLEEKHNFHRFMFFQFSVAME